MGMVLILFIVAIIAGIFGFGIANAVNHIARFLFYVIVIVIFVILLYGYFSFEIPTNEGTPPTTQEQNTQE